MERWAHDIDLPKLIRPGLSPSWFNDDAIARHLDRLYDANIHAVLSACLVQIYKKEGIPLRVFHADTTDVSVYGIILFFDKKPFIRFFLVCSAWVQSLG
ncbi:DUF4277 domain-containing protein [Anoxybacillus flavithermus]